jgi:hypothetical protein
MATLLEEISTYFANLTATHEIASNFGSAFTENTNLFIGVEPATPTDCVSIIPYGGGVADNRRPGAQSPSFQVRVRTTTYKKGFKTVQAVINAVHLNDRITTTIPAKFYAVQSQPILLTYDEEEYPIFVCNFSAKSIKYSVS